MDILINHWHCIIPIAVILGVIFFMGRKDNEKTPKDK